MKISRILCSILLAVVSWFASAADLTFDVRINRGAEVDSNPQVKKQTIAIFVIDCSGSMRKPYEPDGKAYRGPSGRDAVWSRVKLVCDKLLPERFEALPPGTYVYAYMYSCNAGKMENSWLTAGQEHLTSPEKSRNFLNFLQQQIPARVRKNGATPYYDTMEHVLLSIKKADLLNNPNVNLMLFDYTDGENAPNGFSGFSYQADQDNPREKRAAMDRFNRKWGNYLKEISKKGFYEELNIGSPQDNPNVKHIPAYKVAFSCDNSVLKSPQDAASQKVPLYVSFPVNQENWELLLRQDQCSVNVQIGNSPSRRYPVSLRKGNSFTLQIPDAAMNKPTKVTLALECSKGVPGKFTLAAPAKPITFYLPASQKPTIENVRISPQQIVLKGKSVYFEAEGNAKDYVWSFSDGVKLNGTSVSRKFDRVGSVQYTVSPAKNPASKKSGKIDVVAIDIAIVPQGGKLTVPGTDALLRANVSKKCLLPSSCTWYVTEPADPKSKENPVTIRLVSGANPLQNSYNFRKPGEYKIKVVAAYDALPTEVLEAETPWIVTEPAVIAFSKSMEGKDHLFEFGKPVSLSIDVISGKIDDKSIVWKENGKVIARGTRKVEYRSRAKGQVKYTVEAMDAALKKAVEPKEITYFFGCNHVEPIVKAVCKDGSSSWGVGDEVEFKITPEDQYTDISWEFGDDPAAGFVKVTNGQSITRRAKKSGKFTNTLRCKCRKKECQQEFVKKLITETQYKEPKPRLKLKPEKSSYSKGEGVVLCDAGVGDYFKCRLLVQNPATGVFEEYKVLERNFEEEISLGSERFPVPRSQRADFVFQIQALDQNGKAVMTQAGKPAEPAQRTIRVRNHWISAAILLAVIALFVTIFTILAKFLLGNGPRKWKLYYKVNKSEPERETYAKECAKVARSSNILLDKYWKVGKRQAFIESKKLLGSGPYPSYELIIDPKQKMTLYFRPHLEKLGEFPPNPNYSSGIFKVQPANSTDDHDERIRYLLLLLDKSKNAHGSEIVFYVLLILALLGLIAAILWMFML